MYIPQATTIFLTCAVALAACGKREPLVFPAFVPAEPAVSAASAAPVAAVAPAAPVVAVAPNAQVAIAEEPPVVPVRAAPVPPEREAGKRVFDKTCGLCHGAGVGGAPRPGDQANWAPRVAQGMDTLYRHALEGFTGATSYMPARGGAALTDTEVKAGVDYLVSLSR